jgi:hypothetical protein
MKTNPMDRILWARVMRAALEALLTALNMDSPKKHRPRDTP